jgi:hypothetical protein
MALRWTAAGVLEAECGFRKLTGYRALPALVAALRAHDPNGARPGVDETRESHLIDNQAAIQFQHPSTTSRSGCEYKTWYCRTPNVLK